MLLGEKVLPCTIQNASGSCLALSKTLLMAAVWGVVVTICNVPKVGNAQQATANETPSAQHLGSEEEQFPPIKYAVNSGKPCLIYDTIGSLRLLPRTDMQRESPVPNPRLQVFPDGRVLTEQRGKIPPFEATISKSRLSDLMGFAVNKASIFDIESSGIATHLQGVGSSSGSATLFRVLLERGEHELVIQGLGFEARAAGATDDVKRLDELGNRCNQIYTEINLGTRQEQLKILALLETELSQKFPKVKPFTLADLCLAGRTPEGRLRSCFKKVLTNEETNKRYQLLGAVSRDSESEDYTIKITTAPSR